MVVLRLNLDQVEPDQIEAAQPAHQPERIAAGRSPDFGRAGPWREARVNEIDVKAQEDRTLPDALEHLGQNLTDASLQERLGRDQVEAQRSRAVAIRWSIQRASDAELYRPRGIDQPFLDRPATPRAMGVPLSPVVVPGIRVRIEIDQTDRSVPLEDRAELSQGYGVVPAKSERDYSGIQDRLQPFFDDRVRGLHVSRYHRQVARVDRGDELEDVDVLLDVVRPQQPRRFANGRRAESAADPVAHRGVERDPDERGVDAGHVHHIGESHESPDPGKSRRLHGVDRPVARYTRPTALRHVRARTPPLSGSLRGSCRRPGCATRRIGGHSASRTFEAVECRPREWSESVLVGWSSRR